ncbi:MAG: hypothetical protein EU521_01485 [Promethearchaeota archaeon]|nr:MAG: hypothetical protein EU521_01485 [Candidatus Lokiarchaeota archaeon]
MHINAHFAIGIIIASLFNAIYDFNLLEFGLIVVCGFIMDFDVFFSKFAKDGNHRMLLSHSIIPGIILFIIGMLFLWPALVISGLAFIIHIVIDTLDWGTNFFGVHKKPFGPKLLISKEEFDNIDEVLTQYKIKKAFFDIRYYSKKIIIAIEISLFIFMILTVFMFASEYFLWSLIYFPFLFFHLLVYFQMKKIEGK